jgi:hypothetical protein
LPPADKRDVVTSPSGDPVERRPFPFWVLQVTELIVAMVFVDVSVHVRGGGLLLVGAVVLAALAVTAQGPLGVLRLCPQRLHLTLIVTASLLIAAAPLLPGLRPDLEGIIVVEFGAAGLIRVATLSRADDRAGVGARRGHARVIDTTASVAERPVPVHPQSGQSTGAPPPSNGDSGMEGMARRAGRTAAATEAAGRRLWARHRPTAEAQLKRSIRNAGRWARRVTSPPVDPKSGPE